LLRFREITYAKNVDFPSGIFLSNAKQKKPIVFLLFRGTMKSYVTFVLRYDNTPWVRLCSNGGQHEGRVLAGHYEFSANISFTFQESRISLLIPHIYVLSRFVNFWVIFRYMKG